MHDLEAFRAAARTVVVPLAVALALSASLGACASSSGIENTGYAAAQPLRDFNIGNPRVPAQLQALNNPFGFTGGTCYALAHEIQALQSAITANSGRHVGTRRSSSAGNAWDTGVATAATFWNLFRGLTRQLSGAARADARAEAASDQARYRVGYLIGQARAYRCPGF